MERLNSGGWKWGALAATIVALEVLPPHSESLTHACGRALDTPVGKVAVPVLMGATVAHLMDWIPHRVDPFYLITEGVDYVKDLNIRH